MVTFYIEQNNNVLSVQLRSDMNINAWQGEVVLPTGISARLNTSQGITSFWQDSPHIQGQSVIFAGGQPNGWSGQGKLFQIILNSVSNKKVIIQNVRVYLNDGQGTEIKVPTSSFSLRSLSAVTPSLDNVPPEPFAPHLYRNTKLFNGRPVVIFDTQDKQSGVARYEVKEFTSAGMGDWHTALSPYLINPDVKRLEIKAVDNYGNERLEYLRIWPQYLWSYIALAILGTITAAWILYNKRK